MLHNPPQALHIDVPPQQLLDESEPLLQARYVYSMCTLHVYAPVRLSHTSPPTCSRWHGCRLLPGVMRLLQHLQTHHPTLPLAIVTSTPLATFNAKMTTHASLKHAFSVVVTGDAVAAGKPAPDGFLQAADRLGVPPAACLVVEDALTGVEAALAAGMRVVAVPSVTGGQAWDALPSGKHGYGVCRRRPWIRGTGAVERLTSLLQFDPARYGLAPFDDLIGGGVACCVCSCVFSVVGVLRAVCIQCRWPRAL